LKDVLYSLDTFLCTRIRAAVEAISKVGKFDPDIMQKADRVIMPLVTFANRLPKAPMKSKKDVEEKKPPASSSAASGSSRPNKGPKELHDRIERLEERVNELEVWRTVSAILLSCMLCISPKLTDT
jgi:hypothetical protein